MDKKTTIELGKLSREVDETIKGMTDEERAKFARRIVALAVPNFEVEEPGGIEAVKKFVRRQLNVKMMKE